MSILIADVVQMISQYSPQVYCTLRLVSKEVKEMVDEVLPVAGVRMQTIYQHDSCKELNQWRVKFLRNADWCGFKLLEREDFYSWMNCMIFAYVNGDENHGERVERFCRDYLPMDGILGIELLYLLCRWNRKDYVRELWNEVVVKKRLRFFDELLSDSDWIEVISMLDDLEFVKLVYEYFINKMTVHLVMKAIQHAITCYRWTNVRYLVKIHPELNDDHVMKSNIEYSFSTGDWDLFHRVDSIRRDKDVFLEAVKQYGDVLRFADVSLQKDKEVVLEAVKQDGTALKYADESLRKDKEVVMAAVNQNGDSLAFADKSLQRNSRFKGKKRIGLFSRKIL